MDEEPADSRPTVIGRRPRASPRSRVFGLILICAVIVFAIVDRRYFLLSLYVLLVITQFVFQLRPSTVVSAAGIQRPWRRRTFIDWGQVSSVSRPIPGMFAPQLNLVEAKALRWMMFPPTRPP